MLACPINFISAGRLMPARTMSEAKVVRKRCGLASLMLVVWRWWRNKERNPARVMRTPRMRPLSETNNAAEQGSGRSGGGNVRAVARFPARAAGSEICYLCHEREAGLRKATRRPDSKPILRRTAALAKASVPRWPNRARCGNWTRSARLHSRKAAQCYVWGPSRAAGSSLLAAGQGPWAFAARTRDESRGPFGREHRGTHCGWHDRQQRRGH